MTALMMAVKEGQAAIVNALVECQADVNVQENVSPAGILWTVHCMSNRRASAMDMHV